MISFVAASCFTTFAALAGLLVGYRYGGQDERGRWLRLIGLGLKQINEKHITDRDFTEYIATNAAGVADDGWSL